MMRQYLEIKAQQPDAILFYRMGDFYEMFLDDAQRAAPLLDIALTTRSKDKANAIPMCGVPVHAAQQHIETLISKGYRVAICEQVEDPKAVVGRKLVKREVVEVITPGLCGDPASLDAKREIALAALVGERVGEGVGLAVLDASTGDFRVTCVAADGVSVLPSALLDEIERIAPSEVLVPTREQEQWLRVLRERLPNTALTAIEVQSCIPAAVNSPPAGFDPSALDSGTMAAAAILAYLRANQPFVRSRIHHLRSYALSETMIVDAATRSHLELFESSGDRSRRGTLIERIDETVTALGARRIARWLAYPLKDCEAIAQRLDAVEFFAETDRVRARLRDALAPVRDLERIFARAVRPSSTPRDLGALRASLLALPHVKEVLGEAESEQSGLPAMVRMPEPVDEAACLLVEALVDDPPAIPKGSRGASESGYIREGFRPALDEIHYAAKKGREWIAALEAKERRRSGIGNLKLRFHPVHGYSIEVTKSNLERVPSDYQRKQTLANVERFTTPELADVASQVLGARERAAALEREIFERIRNTVLEFAEPIRRAAEAVAELDALAALAEVARKDAWVRPIVDESDSLQIAEGRHPVVEAMLRERGEGAFVANDTALSCSQTQILILTGPNMSGKSTYLRQVALICLLAQMGSFVPATNVRIGVVDRIFTRVGASDRLARGESTFMVEMRETATILTQASQRSLVILDEIGRGTSTFDGLSIAWAVAEYLHDEPACRARTLFATHYHELSELERAKVRVSNAHFEARQCGDDVEFLRRLVPGAASSSYGIQVARLAGLPETVLMRAKEILHNLEAGEFSSDGSPLLAQPTRTDRERSQLALFQAPALQGGTAIEREVVTGLRSCDLDRLTPIDALLTLRRFAEKLSGGGGAA